MKLVLKNIGGITSAAIDCDGITIIAGPNNSGKTAINRALFAVLSCCSQVQEHCVFERIISLERLLKQLSIFSDKDALYTFREGINQGKTGLAATNEGDQADSKLYELKLNAVAIFLATHVDDYKYCDVPAFKQKLSILLAAAFGENKSDCNLQVDKAVDNQANWWVDTDDDVLNRMLEILQISEQSYLQLMLEKHLQTEFHQQICNVFLDASEKEGLIQLQHQITQQNTTQQHTIQQQTTEPHIKLQQTTQQYTTEQHTTDLSVKINEQGAVATNVHKLHDLSALAQVAADVVYIGDYRALNAPSPELEQAVLHEEHKACQEQFQSQKSFLSQLLFTMQAQIQAQTASQSSLQSVTQSATQNLSQRSSQTASQRASQTISQEAVDNSYTGLEQTIYQDVFNTQQVYWKQLPYQTLYRTEDGLGHSQQLQALLFSRYEQNEHVDEPQKLIYEKLTAICSGKVRLTKRGVVEYQEPTWSRGLDIRNISSGMKPFLILKTLLDKGVFKRGGLLIFEEPEVHLYPEWQLCLAEILVLLQAKLGVSIVLNTHSPYFINAVEVYAAKYGVKDKCRYYLAQVPKQEACRTEGAAEQTHDSNHVTNSSALVTEETAQVTDSSALVTDETAHVTDSSAHVTNESAHVTDSSALVTDESAHVVDVTNNIEAIYSLFAHPFQDLENEVGRLDD